MDLFKTATRGANGFLPKEYFALVNFLNKKYGINHDEAHESIHEYGRKALLLTTTDKKVLGVQIQANFGAFVKWNKEYQKNKRLNKNNPWK